MIKHQWIAIIACCLINPVAANANKIQSYIEQNYPNSSVGLVIQDVNNHQIVYQQRANENFYPASNTKIVTSIAALEKLTPNYRYRTPIYADLTQLINNTLNANVYLKFSGDPSFRHQDLSQLLKTLKNKQIQKIQGNLIIDDSQFDNHVYGPGWPQDSAFWYYAAPVHTIIIDENKIRLNVAKYNQGDKIEIKKSTALPFTLTSHVKAVSAQKAKNECQFEVQNSHNQFNLSGCWPKDKTPTVLELAIGDPRLLAKQLIEKNLRELGITLTGSIQFGKVPANTPTLATHTSVPLRQLITKVLGDSNNLYTESITKTLGVEAKNQGTFQAGTNVIKAVMANQFQIPFDNHRLQDGSGLSRYNLLTPHLLAQLLDSIQDKSYYADFKQALAISGKTGTLQTRMQSDSMVGNIRAKTGSAKGTSALSGYFTGKSGRQYLFALLVNQSAKDFEELKAIEDKLCYQLIQEPWGT